MTVWKQGEHVAIVGDTGSGKTFLTSKLLPQRGAVLVLRTKPDDITFPGFVRISSVKEIRHGQFYYLLDPPYERQRAACAEALEMAWRDGKWCVSIDELYYATDRLKLTSMIDRLLTQGRSKKISVVVGMQRPVAVSRFALSQATHVLSFAIEGRDVKTMAEATTPRIIPELERLRRFQFAYFNRKTREVGVSSADRLEEVFA